MKYKVAQVIPYFGKWPEWIELYFYSCGRNPMVDFIFYTDCSLPQHRYKNTIFRHCSYDDYCQIVSECLGIDYHCRQSYKLTDLKPFLGFIHKDDFKEYDFWGFGDLDLVYGNLGMMLNESNLNHYDVITTHNYHIAGHCCFFRNTEYYRNLCFNIKDWKQKLIDEKPLSMDELDFSYQVMPWLKNIGRIHKYLCKPLGIHYFKVLDALNPILHSKMMVQECWTSPQPHHNEIWTYDLKQNIVVTPWGIQLPYLHFLFFKKTQWLEKDLYWHEGFYQINNPVESYEKIQISIRGIK